MALMERDVAAAVRQETVRILAVQWLHCALCSIHHHACRTRCFNGRYTVEYPPNDNRPLPSPGEGARFRAGEGPRGPRGHRRRRLADRTHRCHCGGPDSRHRGLHAPEQALEVAVTTNGDTVTLSRPRRLFARRAPLTEIGPDGFDVARDGRFLLLERVASSTERVVHVVLNWTPRRAPGT